MEYEYKVVPVQNEVGFDFNKKCARLEEQMNRLGKEGWRFCLRQRGHGLSSRKTTAEIATGF